MSVKDFLKQRAVNISVGGHYTLANWFDAQGKPRTFACPTSRVFAVPDAGRCACGRLGRGSRHILFR
jgi:hypothetical protein